MMTLATFEDIWITLMLVAMLTSQAHVALLDADQVTLVHQLRARLHATGQGVAGVLAACADVETLLAAIEEG